MVADLSSEAELNQEAVSIGDYAMDAYCSFYPEATFYDVVQVMRACTQISPSIANSLRSNAKVSRSDPEDTYWLHPERTGFFVCVPHRYRKGLYVVTFFRFFSIISYRRAVHLYGPGNDVTARADCRWPQQMRGPIDRISLEQVLDLQVHKSFSEISWRKVHISSSASRVITEPGQPRPTKDELRRMCMHSEPVLGEAMRSLPVVQAYTHCRPLILWTLRETKSVLLCRQENEDKPYTLIGIEHGRIHG